MTNFWVYFFETQLALGMLYGVYRAVLHPSSWLRLQRLVLLLLPLLALCLPQVPRLWLLPTQWAALHTLPVVQLPAVVVGNASGAATLQAAFPWYGFLTSVYLGIATLRLGWMLWQMHRHLQLPASAHRSRYRGITLLQDAKIETPFTFFRRIYLPTHLAHNTYVLAHESAHARQLHSVDRLWAEVVLSLFWVNPLAYHWRAALCELHELQADRHALGSGLAAADYGRMILQEAYAAQGLAFSSGFSNNFLKKRIVMLHKNKPSGWLRPALMLVLLPIISFALAKPNNERAGSISGQNANYSAEIKAEKVAPIAPDPTQKVDTIFHIVDQMPEYPGGIDGLQAYLIANLRYPDEAKKAKVEGRSMVRFVVSDKGKVISPEIARSSGSKELDAEALRVVSGMGDWIPGRSAQKPVSVYYLVPIQFALN